MVAALGWSSAGLLAAPPAQEEVLGSSSAVQDDTEPLEPIAIEPGTRLHERPHLHARAVTVIDVPIQVVPIERRGPWVRLAFAERVGWAYLGEQAPPPAAEPPAAPALPIQPVEEAELPALEPGEERLGRALDLLEVSEPSFDTGLFKLYTDVRGRRTRELCEQIAEVLPTSYLERYGIRPLREATFAIALFDRERTYRNFENDVADLVDLDAVGHAGSGVAALVVGPRTANQVGSLLIHELTHLLNRRVFLKTPPPWVEEGLANDLAYSRLDQQDRPILGSLGGRSFVAELPPDRDRFGRLVPRGTVHIQGAVASLNLLKRAVLEDRLLPLDEFLELSWREFVVPDGRELRYVQSGFLVRFLIASYGQSAFRDFLAAYQRGGGAGVEEVLALSGLDLPDLEQAFADWVLDHPSGR